MEAPRLSSYPYVIVRVACVSCKRKGYYRLARLAERFGAEAPLTQMLAGLSADCPARGIKRFKGSYQVSILKRGITGTYHHVSEAHLHRYLAEFDFRHNNRSKLGVEDGERFARMVKGVVGKRLTYQTVVG